MQVLVAVMEQVLQVEEEAVVSLQEAPNLSLQWLDSQSRFYQRLDRSPRPILAEEAVASLKMKLSSTDKSPIDKSIQEKH
jgi:hypothetical protein